MAQEGQPRLKGLSAQMADLQHHQGLPQAQVPDSKLTRIIFSYLEVLSEFTL